MSKKQDKVDNADDKTPKVIDIAGKRPIEPGTLEVTETLDIDGKRPVTSGDTNVTKLCKYSKFSLLAHSCGISR